MTTPRPLRRRVDMPSHSTCHGAALADLDWRNWFTAGAAAQPALYVWHRNGETTHRVHCRLARAPRLAMVDGHLCWLIDRHAASAEPGSPAAAERDPNTPDLFDLQPDTATA